MPRGVALGKENFQKKIKALCRVPSGLALGKEFFLKKKSFAECMEGWHSAKKILKKKIKALCRVPHVLALGKESFKKNLKNLCRVPAGLTLGKVTVNGTGAVTGTFLCRVFPGHSAKPLPSAR